MITVSKIAHIEMMRFDADLKSITVFAVRDEASDPDVQGPTVLGVVRHETIGGAGETMLVEPQRIEALVRAIDPLLVGMSLW